jgi:hypothetical protein
LNGEPNRRGLIAVLATYLFCGVGSYLLLVVINAITPHA